MVEIIIGVKGQVNSRGYKPSNYDEVFSRMKYKLTETMELAVKEAKEILSDGQWHRTKSIYSIAAKYGVRRGNLMYQLPVAVSDSMTYFCIPGENTPLLDPFEMARLKGEA